MCKEWVVQCPVLGRVFHQGVAGCFRTGFSLGHDRRRPGIVQSVLWRPVWSDRLGWSAQAARLWDDVKKKRVAAEARIAATAATQQQNKVHVVWLSAIAVRPQLLMCGLLMD